MPRCCKSASLEEVRKHGHVPTQRRLAGTVHRAEDDEPIEDETKRPVAQLRGRQAEGTRLDAAIEANLVRLGFREVAREHRYGLFAAMHPEP